MAISQTSPSTAVRTHRERPVAREHGILMPIGGAEDKLDDKIILSAFAQIAGGKSARIVIVPTASSIESAGFRYKAIFLGMGVESAEVVYIANRDDANGHAPLELLQDATGIFLTGGNQMRLSAMIGGTRFEQLVRERHQAGAVVAGTSAGASIVSAHLMAGGTGLTGNSNDAAARKGMVELVAGFGLLQDVIIDQHFSQRGRMGRLLATFAANPGLLAIGLDEDTAVLIDREG
ncbi:MAG: cyanophycinase, partial [Chloroflexota bacterium]|nr:cyanophycinase [Chloroflexota bacterium]